MIAAEMRRRQDPTREHLADRHHWQMRSTITGRLIITRDWIAMLGQKPLSVWRRERCASHGRDFQASAAPQECSARRRVGKR
jgi:hypothetical protein